MSEANPKTKPSPTHETDVSVAAPPRRRRRWLRRLFLVLLILFVPFLGLGTVAVFRPSWLVSEEWLRDQIVRTLREKTDREVEIGLMELPRLGRVKLKNVVFKSGKEPAHPPLMRAESFTLYVKILPLLRGQLIIQRLTLREPSFCLDADYLTGLEFQGPAPDAADIMARLAVEELLVKDANLLLLDDDGSEAFSITGFDVRAQGAQFQPLDYEMVFRIQGRGIAGDVRSSGTLTAFRDSGHRLDVSSLSFTSRMLQANLYGKVTNEQQRPHLSLVLEGEGSLPVLRRLLASVSVPIPEEIDVKGSSKMQVTFSGPMTDLTIEGVVDVPEDAVTYAGKPFMRWPSDGDVRFHVHVQEGQADVKNLTITSSLGKVTVKGSVRDEEERTDLDFRIAATADANELLKLLSRTGAAGVTRGMSAEGEAKSLLRVSGTPDDVRIDGEVDLDAVAVRRGDTAVKKKGEKAKAAVDVSLRDTHLVVGPGTKLTTRFGTVGVAGSIRSPTGTPVLDLDMDVDADVAACWSLATGEAAKRLAASGRAKAKARLEGTPSHLNLAGSVDLGEVTMAWDGRPLLKSGEPTSLAFDLRFTEAETRLNSVDLSTGLGTACLRGRLLPGESGLRPDLQFDASVKLKQALATAVAHGMKALPEAVTLTGSVRATGSVKEDRRGTCRIDGDVSLADCELRYQDLVLKPRRYDPDLRVRIAAGRDRVALEKLTYRSEAVTLEGSGRVRDGGILDLDMSAVFRLAEYQPLLQAALRQAVSTLDLRGLPADEAELLRRVDDDVDLRGTLSAKLAASVGLDEVHVNGSIDTSEATAHYRKIELTKGTRKSGLNFKARADGKKVTVSSLTLNSDVGRVTAEGEVVLGEEATWDVEVRSDFEIGRWLANLPVEEIRSDAAVSRFLERRGIRPPFLQDRLHASGTAHAGLGLQGRAEAHRLLGFLDLSKSDLKLLNERGDTLAHKPIGTLTRSGFNIVKRGRDWAFETLQIEYDDHVCSAKGRIRLSPGHVKADDVLVSVDDRRAKVSLDLDVTKQNVAVRRAEVLYGGNLWRLNGDVAFTEDRIGIDDFRIRVNDSKLLVDFDARDYAGAKPEIHVHVLSPVLDTCSILPALPLAPDRQLSEAEAAETGMALVAERMPDRLRAFLRNAKVDVTVFVGELVFRIDDRQDREPAMRQYEPKNVSVKAALRDGVCLADVKAVWNDGMVDLAWRADFNGDLMLHNLDYWADGIGAHDNLRPFLNFTFSNLYCLGELGFDGSASWQGLCGHNAFRSMHGRTKMYIDDGYLLGKAAPEYMIRLFPWLHLGQARWRFRRGDIVSVTEGTVATNHMRFRYPGSTYMTGTTHNLTRTISYVFGVDLVDSFGLGESTGIVPDNIENKSSIDICRYVGTLSDQKVEWFKLRGDEMKNLFKKLLHVQMLSDLFTSRRTPMEKFEYIEGRAINVITAPVRAGESVITTPRRVIKRIDDGELERIERRRIREREEERGQEKDRTKEQKK